jgi:hypothetical protein
MAKKNDDAATDETPGTDPLDTVAEAMAAATGGPADAGEWTPQTVSYRVSDNEVYPYATLVTRPQPPLGAADVSFTTAQGSAGFAANVPHASEATPGQPSWQEYDV